MKVKQAFLTGTKVKLRKITESDYPPYIKMEGDMETRLLADDDLPFPPTEEDHKTFLKGISSKKDEYMFVVETLDTHTFIGTIGLFRTNWKNGTCYVGITLSSDYQGKGYGTDAMNVLVDYIFTYINLNKVKLEVFSSNERAIRSYEKCGFKKEGTLREEIFRYGAFQDITVMGILRGEWENRS
ncbi:GNAT family N-acetyltransferase [Priestia taiwanensis]|uniref:N-acetyltransferase n=1 Tax=Priestia taiwanensis TaxID=1347902 RepID=A0A917AQ91_9BACI|nr:GNAT family protein [Priestia taiwanensis]MBM7363095.1 RimJ/RimL family protein N-acetyltransferase [Priestia taiwanensis]GGE67661.1 N-acetyltransferase [Priestia taiwanensis]